MSAWVVSKTHIDLLVRAAIHAARPGDRFGWWQVDETGAYAGCRQLDEMASGEEDDVMSPSQLGQLLVSENVASVSYRYSEPGRDYYYGAEAAAGMEDLEADAGELPGPCDPYYIGPYVYANPGYTLSPGEVFQAIGCLDYQSCEHPGWRTSEAFACLAALRDVYCTRVEGYQGAPWGWEAEDLDKRSLEFSRRVI